MKSELKYLSNEVQLEQLNNFWPISDSSGSDRKLSVVSDLELKLAIDYSFMSKNDNFKLK